VATRRGLRHVQVGSASRCALRRASSCLLSKRCWDGDSVWLAWMLRHGIWKKFAASGLRERPKRRTHVMAVIPATFLILRPYPHLSFRLAARPCIPAATKTNHQGFN
jgi:hypothetical protein